MSAIDHSHLPVDIDRFGMPTVFRMTVLALPPILVRNLIIVARRDLHPRVPPRCKCRPPPEGGTMRRLAGVIHHPCRHMAQLVTQGLRQFVGIIKDLGGQFDADIEAVRVSAGPTHGPLKYCYSRSCVEPGIPTDLQIVWQLALEDPFVHLKE